MCDDALMLFLFLLVYVIISNNHCKFLTKSKNYKSNDIIHILIVNKRNEKSDILINKHINMFFFLKGSLKMRDLENKLIGNWVATLDNTHIVVMVRGCHNHSIV